MKTHLPTPRTAISAFALLFVLCGTLSSQSRWKVPVQFVTGPTTIILELGVYGDGPAGSIIDNTLGFDGPPFVTVADPAFEDLVAPPAPPAPFDLHARFLTPPGYVTTIPTGLGASGALRDIRGFASTSQVDTFLVRIDGEDASGLFAQTTISWPANLTTFASSWTMKPQTGSDFTQLDMTTQQSLTFTPSGTSVRILIIKSGSSLVNVPASENALPTEFTLGQNYPNPFNPSTRISFSVPERSLVTLTVFDILGRPVRQLVSGTVSAGRHEVSFDASDFASGIYFYQLQAGTTTLTRRMTLMK